MKVAIAQLNFTVGDFEANKVKIIDAVIKAKNAGADLAVFSEQAISGAPAYDLLNKITFLDLCEDALVEIASHCDDIAVIVGMPLSHKNNTISAAALIKDRKIVKFIGKQNVSSRDEVRHIVPSDGVEYVKIGGHKVAIVVGDDIRAEQHYGDYADTIVNVALSPYARGIVEKRYDFFKNLAFMTGKNVVFANSVGGQTDIVCDGSSAVFNGEGQAVMLLENFEEDFGVIDLAAGNKPIEIPYQNKTRNVYRALKLGLRDYFGKNGFRTAALGLSGGIDSAVVLAIAAEVLGPQNITVMMLPSLYSTVHSIEDARVLAENLGVNYKIVPISSAYTAVLKEMRTAFGEMPFDVTEENIQARLRMVYLMALCNKYGHVLLNTSNKSELAVGYGTLYGDSAGSISILGDVYKSEVFDLARYINRDREIIPENTIVKEPSAELRPEQKDSDSLPAYEELDAILYRMVEEGQHREEIINAGFDTGMVMRVYRMVNRNEYKRSQFCPILRMSTCTFRKGRVWPLTNKYGNWGAL